MPARKRATELAAATGKTITKIVEDAVLSYRPELPPTRVRAPDGFHWKGWLLVQDANGRAPLPLEAHLALIDAARDRELFNDGDD